MTTVNACNTSSQGLLGYDGIILAISDGFASSDDSKDRASEDAVENGCKIAASNWLYDL